MVPLSASVLSHFAKSHRLVSSSPVIQWQPRRAGRRRRLPLTMQGRAIPDQCDSGSVQPPSDPDGFIRSSGRAPAPPLLEGFRPLRAHQLCRSQGGLGRSLGAWRDPASWRLEHRGSGNCGRQMPGRCPAPPAIRARVAVATLGPSAKRRPAVHQSPAPAVSMIPSTGTPANIRQRRGPSVSFGERSASRASRASRSK